MKMLCFKAFGNRFKQAVEPLNDAKRKVLSTSNMRRRGNVRKVDHMWPNLRIGNIGGVWAGGGGVARATPKFYGRAKSNTKLGKT